LPILSGYEFVIDGTDNFPSKFLVADACHFARTSYSHAGILRFCGQTVTVIPGETACFRCLFRGPPPQGTVPSCAEAGVLGVVAGVIGTIQAAEAIRYLLGVGQLLTNRLLYWDALNMEFHETRTQRSASCPLCGDAPEIAELREEEQTQCDPAVCDCYSTSGATAYDAHDPANGVR